MSLRRKKDILLAGWMLLAVISPGLLIGVSHASKESDVTDLNEPSKPRASSENQFKRRAINVYELGKMTIYPDESWRFEGGPKGTRSVSRFKNAKWVGDGIRAESLWGNGTYTSSPEGIVEVTVRFLFETDDDALLYVDYLARFDWDEQASGVVAGPIMTGRIETNDERYAWLNKTQLIGKGSFEDGSGSTAMQMQYVLYALPNSPSPDFE